MIVHNNNIIVLLTNYFTYLLLFYLCVDLLGDDGDDSDKKIGDSLSASQVVSVTQNSELDKVHNIGIQGRMQTAVDKEEETTANTIIQVDDDGNAEVQQDAMVAV